MALTFKPFIIVEVYEADGQTLIAEVPRRWDISGSEPLNIPGVGTITVSSDDAIITRHPGIFGMGNWVKFWLGDGLGHGDYVHGFQIRQRKTRFRGVAEASDRLLTVAGPTPLALLDDFIVKHDVQPPRNDSSETRSYAWTAKPGEWFHSTDWDDAVTELGAWNSHITVPRSGTVAKPLYQPPDFPDPDAKWIKITSAATWNFFRRVVTIPSGGLLVELYATADEILRVFLDGDLVISRDEYENGYKSFSKYKVFLPAGDHYVGLMMRTKGTPGGDGVDAVLFSMMSINARGNPDTYLIHTSDVWNAHAGLPVPGWNQAQILRSQIAEAQARGNDSALLLTVDFDEDVDTAGVPYPIQISKNMRIGTSILDSQTQLSELGSFDVWVDPADFKIKAWVQRGLDMSNSVTYEPGRNLLNWEVDENDRIKNDALVRYDGGWTSYQAATSITNYGAREIYISLGSVADDDTAETIASAHIERRKHAKKRAGASELIDKNKDDQPTAAVVLSPGTVVGIDYRTGSYLKVPSGTGVKTKQRLLGVTFGEDNDTGQVVVDPEFDEEE
jgi:hypothetical protein